MDEGIVPIACQLLCNYRHQLHYNHSVFEIYNDTFRVLHTSIGILTE